MNESATLDRGQEYTPRYADSERNHVQDRIRALGAQRQAHIDLAAAIAREIKALKRQAGIDTHAV